MINYREGWPAAPSSRRETFRRTSEKDAPAFVKDHKATMPQPERWDEFVEKLKHAWLSQVKVDTTQLKTVQCSVLVGGGDRDQYNTVESFVNVYRSLTHTSLAIVPSADHIIFYCNPELMEKLVTAFVMK